MPSPKDIQLLKDRERQLRARGIVAELEIIPGPKRQWYRADGAPMPNLLPADPYHIRAYEKKGWTLIPGAGNEKTVEDWKPRALKETATPFLDAQVQTKKELPQEKPHTHRYTRRSQGKCVIKGCDHVKYGAKTRAVTMPEAQR